MDAIRSDMKTWDRVLLTWFMTLLLDSEGELILWRGGFCNTYTHFTVYFTSKFYNIYIYIFSFKAIM